MSDDIQLPIDGGMLIAMVRDLEWKRRAVSVAIDLLQPLCTCARSVAICVHANECPVARVINIATGLEP
jgi:hypothetical protein